MIKSTDSRFSATNSWPVRVMFWITILFQLTALKYIWSIERLSTIANLIALLYLSFSAFRSLVSGSFSKKIWISYIIPGTFIFLGMLLNISINILSNIKLVSYFGLIIPWAAYLCVPALLKKNVLNSRILWSYYYYFMIAASILGFIDYIMYFFGAIYFRELVTPNGIFLGGYFSLFHMIEDGTAYYRFYSCFSEPGTFAMFLLPAIAYAYFYKKYMGLMVFIIADYLTDSLGGIIGLIMLAIIIMYDTFKRRYTIAIIAVAISTSVLWIALGEYASTAYENKNASRTVREESFFNTMFNLPALFINNPIGFQLAENSEALEKNDLYFGSNFTPGNMLRVGGISAFMGYLACLFVSVRTTLSYVRRKKLSPEEKVVFSSLIVLFPFIFQRTTVWESAIFAFLFAPSIIRGLQLSKQAQQT